MTPRPLLDLAHPSSAEAFSPIGDAVMGGRSWGRAEHSGGRLVFSGVVSLEDGGGFASIRSAPRPLDLTGHDGLALTALGDGRRYRLNLRTDEAFDGVTWQAPLDLPAGALTTLTLPFAAFAPRHRGRPVPEAGPFDPSRLVTIGFLVGDRQAGPFRLEVARLEAVSLPFVATPGAAPDPVEGR